MAYITKTLTFKGNPISVVFVIEDGKCVRLGFPTLGTDEMVKPDDIPEFCRVSMEAYNMISDVIREVDNEQNTA